MRLAGHVAYMGEIRNVGLGVDGKVIFKYISVK
jgi:hypothetical protein